MRISATFSFDWWKKAWTYGVVSFFLWIGSLFGSDTINNLIIVKDYKRALFEIKQKRLLLPDDPTLDSAELLVYARQKNIPLMLETWKKVQKIKGATFHQNELEEMSFAILATAFDSPSLQVRAEATVAAFMANTARTIPLCLQALVDGQVDIRKMSAHFAGRQRDLDIQKKVLAMALHDPSSEVRQEAIFSLGVSRMSQAVPFLKEIILSSETPLQEKFAAIGALVEGSPTPEYPFILSLQKHERFLFRSLACQIVLGKGENDLAEQILPLIEDPSYEVRIFALQCVGLLNPTLLCQKESLPFTDTKTQALWNWACLRAGKPSAEKPSAEKQRAEKQRDLAALRLKQLLQSEDQETRLLTAAAICHLGKEGCVLASECIHETKDPLVRLNLGMYLIWQRKNTLEFAHLVAESLKKTIEPLSWQRFGAFSFASLGTSVEPQRTDVATRLDIYSLLATVPGFPVGGVLSSFIGERMGGVSLASLALMVQEGIITPEMLQNLLESEDENVALQAAILLAIYTKDPKVLTLLEKRYASSSRNSKEQIIFAIGSIGSPSSVAFLASLFDEPFESLRILAASALLRCVT